MGVSFKISKKGTRFHPQPCTETNDGSLPEESSDAQEGAGLKREADLAETVNGVTGVSVSSTCSGGLVFPEHEVSFTLNLFPSGYFIGKPTEMQNFRPLLQDGKSLHPYDRASESLFSAIESGRLPGDILDDIPSKYVDGSLLCEVRDYKKCISDQGIHISTADPVPIVNKVRLRMSLENVVKDIPLISDDSWTYRDLIEVESRIVKVLQPQLCLDPTPMLDRLCEDPNPTKNVVKDIPLISDDSWTYRDLIEVESRIVKVLQPQLCLDPTPMLDRLCEDPNPTKLNLGIGRRKRLRQTPEVTVTSNNRTHGKKVFFESCKEDSQGAVLGNATMQRIHDNPTSQHISSDAPSLRSNSLALETSKHNVQLSTQAKIQPAISYAGVMHDLGSGSSANFSGATGNISSPQNLMGSYTDTVANTALLGKRENQDAQLTPAGSIKRSKQSSLGLDSTQQQIGPDTHWKNHLLHPQIDMKGIQYSTVNGQRFPAQVINNFSNQDTGTSFFFNQQGVRFDAKEEQTDAEKFDGPEAKDTLHALATESNTSEQQQSRLQHLQQHPSMRNHLPPLTQWHNPRQLVDKDMRKDDMIQKRKSVNSPRVSSGPMVQSPVSLKSGEISSGSVGGLFSAVATTSLLGSQKDKATTNSYAAVGAPSMTSSPNDSVHRQHQASAAAKRKSNSITKTQAMSGVGSPASVSNMNVPLNANSPSVGTGPMGDQGVLERFTKIEMVTQRYQLNVKKNKADHHPAKKPISHPSQQISFCVSNSYNTEDFTDQMKPLSRSLTGGTSNTCKFRTMTFTRVDHMYQAVPPRAQYRVIMTEKPSDGTVYMQYGDGDDSDPSNTQDCVLTLPTNHHADILAAQFCMLMEHDGYRKTEDQIKPVPVRMGAATSSLIAGPGMSLDNAAPEVKHPEVTPEQQANISITANNSAMGSQGPCQHASNNARMLISGNSSQALPMSQNYLPGDAMPSRAQQFDQSLLQQQQQQQQHHQLQLQQNQQAQISQSQQLPHPHMQRSSQMLSTNPLSHLIGQNTSLQMGANMVSNKPTPLQLQMFQQQAQQQQQQQNQLPRKMMMGLGAMGIGNMGNNMVGLSGYSNVMGMGGARGISSTMGSISGLGNVNPNQINLGTASGFGGTLRPGSMSVAQAAAMASNRMAVNQNRTGMHGSQSGISGVTGNNNPMLSNTAGLPMFHALNRANMSSLQRNSLSPMGPPKMPGGNYYLNPQQLQLQQQQLQMQQQQQQMQQQQISSPLQQSQVGSPPVVGSPSSMVIQQQQISPQQVGSQQQISPQQLGQQAVMSLQQLSSGTLQQINNGGNAGAAPASPQLSSQTHGSVGSITNSPMDQLQGANNVLNNI